MSKNGGLFKRGGFGVEVRTIDTGIYVGQVDNTTTHLPSKRLDGKPLQNNDYCLVDSNATFPITIDGIVFTNKKSKCIYTKKGNNPFWSVIQGVLQNTFDTTIFNKGEESVKGTSSTANSQHHINKENVEKWIEQDNKNDGLDEKNTEQDEVLSRCLKFVKGVINWDFEANGYALPNVIDREIGELYRITKSGLIDSGNGYVLYNVGDLIYFDGNGWDKVSDASSIIQVDTLPTSNISSNGLYSIKRKINDFVESEGILYDLYNTTCGFITNHPDIVINNTGISENGVLKTWNEITFIYLQELKNNNKIEYISYTEALNSTNKDKTGLILKDNTNQPVIKFSGICNLHPVYEFSLYYNGTGLVNDYVKIYPDTRIKKLEEENYDRKMEISALEGVINTHKTNIKTNKDDINDIKGKVNDNKIKIQNLENTHNIDKQSLESKISGNTQRINGVDTILNTHKNNIKENKDNIAELKTGLQNINTSYETPLFHNTDGSQKIIEISGFGNTKEGETFLIRSRGSECILFTIGKNNQDINVPITYSANRLADGFKKINVISYDTTNKKLYIKIEGWGDLIFQQIGCLKQQFTASVVSSIPYQNVINIPIEKVMKENDNVITFPIVSESSNKWYKVATIRLTEQYTEATANILIQQSYSSERMFRIPNMYSFGVLQASAMTEQSKPFFFGYGQRHRDFISFVRTRDENSLKEFELWVRSFNEDFTTQTITILSKTTKGSASIVFHKDSPPVASIPASTSQKPEMLSCAKQPTSIFGSGPQFEIRNIDRKILVNKSLIIYVAFVRQTRLFAGQIYITNFNGILKACSMSPDVRNVNIESNGLLKFEIGDSSSILEQKAYYEIVE